LTAIFALFYDISITQWGCLTSNLRPGPNLSQTTLFYRKQETVKKIDIFANCSLVDTRWQ